MQRSGFNGFTKEYLRRDRHERECDQEINLGRYMELITRYPQSMELKKEIIKGEQLGAYLHGDTTERNLKRRKINKKEI